MCPIRLMESNLNQVGTHGTIRQASGMRYQVSSPGLRLAAMIRFSVSNVATLSAAFRASRPRRSYLGPNLGQRTVTHRTIDNALP